MTRQTIAQNWNVSRLDGLRDALDQMGLDGLLIPRWDAHQSEYVTERDERLAWASGFSGTWGLAIVMRDKAAIFVDGRYTVQVRNEVNADTFEFLHLYDEPPAQWLIENCTAGTRIGFDPMVIPPVLYDELGGSLGSFGAELSPIDRNPIDDVWRDRPTGPTAPAFALSVGETGEGSASKQARLTGKLTEQGIDLWVETQCDNLAWLFNIRGRDIPENPFLQGFALIGSDGAISFYTDKERLPANEPFEFDGVELRSRDQFAGDLEARLGSGITIGVDPKFGPSLAILLADKAGAEAQVTPNPLTRLKAVKNPVEVDGMGRAGVLDAEVLAELYTWLEDQVPSRGTTNEPITEKEIEFKLEELRQTKGSYVEPSFIPISASGANGAMCHYNAPTQGSAQLGGNDVFLLDTGGQYRCGTTDTTRTTIFGQPTPEQRQAYTLVLKGHIALASQPFPKGTRGYQLDILARQHLWQVHKDYDHGTGHGVGHFLSVHEHPQRLAKDPLDVVIEAGMNLTIEPGYYVSGEYGIRIENLYQVIEMEDGWLGFEPLMFFPIGREMLDPELLTAQEKDWLNKYHAETKLKLSGEGVSQAAKDWIARQTLPV